MLPTLTPEQREQALVKAAAAARSALTEGRPQGRDRGSPRCPGQGL